MVATPKVTSRATHYSSVSGIAGLSGLETPCSAGQRRAASADVNAVPPAGPDREKRTLADILHTKKSRPPVPEGEWVALVRAVAAGEQRALRELFERSHRLVFAFFLRMTRSRDKAEELTLDVFEDVWVKASQYDEEDVTVLGWLMNHARSRAIDCVRFDRGDSESTSNPGTGLMHDR